jgi:hypothetical protein
MWLLTRQGKLRLHSEYSRLEFRGLNILNERCFYPHPKVLYIWMLPSNVSYYSSRFFGRIYFKLIFYEM